ncbi:unnamed protein product [Victoria cruziana]
MAGKTPVTLSETEAIQASLERITKALASLKGKMESRFHEVMPVVEQVKAHSRILEETSATQVEMQNTFKQWHEWTSQTYGQQEQEPWAEDQHQVGCIRSKVHIPNTQERWVPPSYQTPQNPAYGMLGWNSEGQRPQDQASGAHQHQDHASTSTGTMPPPNSPPDLQRRMQERELLRQQQAQQQPPQQGLFNQHNGQDRGMPRGPPPNNGQARGGRGIGNPFANDDSTFYADADWEIPQGAAGPNQVVLPRLKLEFPKFSGKDFKHWIYKVRQYFTCQQVPANQWIRLCSLNFEGQAMEWFTWLVEKRPAMT